MNSVNLAAKLAHAHTNMPKQINTSITDKTVVYSSMFLFTFVLRTELLGGISA